MTSSLTIVHDVLQENSGDFLTVTELKNKIFHDHFTSMNILTIVQAIDTLKKLGHDIIETIIRPAAACKKPTKAFKIIIHNTQPQ